MTVKVAIGPSSFAEKDTAPLEMLTAAGCEVVPNPFKRRLTEAEIIEHLAGVDGLIAGLEPLNRKVIASAPPLRAIARVGIGVTNVDFEAAAEFDVKVSSTPDGPMEAVTEMTLAALLVLFRKIIPASDALHRGGWKKMIGRGVAGSTALVVGCGRIGGRVAKALDALGAHVEVYDPHLADDAIPPFAAHVRDLEDGLSRADVVTLHASGTDVILDRPMLAAMKPDTVLLNSARGELVDENGLVDALRDGTVSAAWFDAFWREPYEGPLVEFDQVLMTPHMGTYTEQCRLRMESEAVANLLRDLELATDVRV